MYTFLHVLTMSKNTDTNVVISNIRIHTMRLPLLGIRSATCNYYPHQRVYYPLFTYEVIMVLYYCINLYAILNNVVITICKLKSINISFVISHRGLLFRRVICIWITQRIL
jgi:hypothetical protein